MDHLTCDMASFNNTTLYLFERLMVRDLGHNTHDMVPTSLQYPHATRRLQLYQDGVQLVDPAANLALTFF